MVRSTNDKAIKYCKEKYKNNDNGYNNCIININPTQNTETLKTDKTFKHLNSKLSNDNKLLPQTNNLINEDCETKLNKIWNIITNKEEENNDFYRKTRTNNSIKKIEDIKKIIGYTSGGKTKSKIKKTKKTKKIKKIKKTKKKTKKKRKTCKKKK